MSRLLEASELDQLLVRLSMRQTEFARAPLARKISWLDQIREGFHKVARGMVEQACRAKRIDFESNLAAEEWLSGPGIILRHARLYRESLERLRRAGSTLDAKNRLSKAVPGKVAVSVLPADSLDGALFPGFEADVWLEGAEVSAGLSKVQTGAFYRRVDPEGQLGLVLGAGNINSIPAVDVLHELFVEGRVCVLKLNPVNEYLKEPFEQAFASLIEQGFLAIVTGGGDVGAYLCQHPLVGHVHVTGSDKTHDTIVWGRTGEERQARKQSGLPLLEKPITSELGNISPAVITPSKYSERELDQMARNVVGSFVLNAGFNCNATKLLVTANGWSQEGDFMRRLGQWLSLSPTRYPYYPGATESYESLVNASTCTTYGNPRDGQLPWAVVEVNSADPEAQPFVNEPFCAVLSHTKVGSGDPSNFFLEVTEFLNRKVWGTLSAMLFISPSAEQDPAYRAPFQRALTELRYGVIGVNQWPAAAFGLASMPWGAYPRSTLHNVQSGIGFVHNAFMIENVEKVVFSGPLVPRPTPMWWPGHRTQRQLAQRYLDYEAAPSLGKVGRLAWHALGA